jgi:hypothetical protein
MRLLPETIDCSDEPDTFCSGVAGIERLGPGTVRVTFFSVREDDQGTAERFVVARQIWDLKEWQQAVALLRSISVERLAPPLPAAMPALN